LVSSLIPSLQLIISNESKRPTSSAEDANLLTQIRDVDGRAGIKFLEYLVLQKKTPDPSLHTQLVTSYLDSLIRYLEDPKVAESQRSAMDGYLGSASRSSRPFLFHLAFETPDSDHKRVRLKLALMLQGSNFYDLEGARRKLRVQESSLRNLLCLETAILDAKVGYYVKCLGEY
jgi:vacuolar protein sorting-associated protein 3